MIFLCLLVFIFGLGFAAKASAATYYVRNISGTYKFLQNDWPTSDTGTGCSANTLKGCILSLDGNGDSMVIAAGDYGAAGQLDFYSGGGVGNIIVRTATESDPAFATYGGTVTIGPLASAGQIINCQSGISNVTVQANSNSPMIVKGYASTGADGVEIYAGSGASAHNVFDGLTFYKYSPAASYIIRVFSVSTNNSGIEIKNSIFQNRSYSAGSDTEKFEYGNDTINGIAIAMSGTGSGVKVYNNTIGGADYRFKNGISIGMLDSEIYGNTVDYSWDGDNYPDGEGDSISVDSAITGVRIYRNLVRYGNKGIQLKSGSNSCYVYYNTVLNSAVNSIDNYNNNTGAFNYIMNNTVIHSGTGNNGHGISHQGSPGKLYNRNNLIYNIGNNAGIDCYAYSASIAADSWDTNYNLCYVTDSGVWSQIDSTNYSTLTAHQIAAAFDNRFVDDAIDPDINSLESDPQFVNYAGANYSLQAVSPAIDSGTNILPISITTDYVGNPIYGTRDIGAYEYQPPYDMGTDELDIAANVRVYGDGKFRNTETVGGTTADLSVVPQASQTTKWLDISKADDESAIIWEANHKKWKESSTTLGETDTLHTIGDLTAGKSYTLVIDGNPASEDPTTGNITSSDCVDSLCTADGTGKITFTYTGGYSEHTFDIDDDIPPVITITSPETGDTVTGDDTITFTDTEQTDPECSIDNSTWVNCTSNLTSFSDLTSWDGIEESDTFTLYMHDTDASGNTGTVSVANLTKADTQAPVRSGGSPSGELASGTTSTTLSLTTSETATCKYSASSGTTYADMTSSLDTTNGTTHTKSISSLSDGNSYSYYVRCEDESNNANDTDYLISFSIASINNDENTDEDNDDEMNLNIHSVKSESTENTITITWRTDHNTKSTIRYGTNKNLKEKKKDNDKEKKHKVTLKDLQPNTKYYFRIKATDSDDNEDSSRIHSIMTKSAQISTSNQNQSENTSQASMENTTTPTYSGNSTPNVCSYTVESGDSLWSIAKKVYGDATAYPQIIEKNKDKYSDIESKLSIGQELTFCDPEKSPDRDNGASNNQNQQTSTQDQTQPQLEIKTFHWYNPFTWF